MVDSIVSFLGQPPSPHPAPAGSRHFKVSYAICNPLGSIILVSERQRVVRKANVLNHVDMRLNTPIDYLRNLPTGPSVTVRIGAEATVWLLYCHRAVEKLRCTCRQLLLLGPSAIVFADHRRTSEEGQSEHSKRCHCGHLCHTRPPTYSLAHGDQITLNRGVFYVAASSEQHSIYMQKKEFQEQVSFAFTGGATAALDFVNALPDTPEPIIT